MASVFCISGLLSRWWNSKLCIEHSFLLQSSTVALNIPLVVDKILRHIPVADLKRLRLVNRTWNHEAVGHLQKRGARVKLYLPYQYNRPTCELLELFEEAMRLEAEMDIKWRWPFTRIHLNTLPFQKLKFQNMELFLRKISLHITDLSVAGGLKLEDSPQECDDLFFPYLTHITWGYSDKSLLNWIIERSPQFSNLVLMDKLQCYAQHTNFFVQNEEEEENKNNWISTAEDLYALVFLLSNQEHRLCTLSMYVYFKDSNNFADFPLLTLDFVNLRKLKIHSYLAAILFGSPDRLPRVKSLVLVLDDAYPDVWLRQWNGEPVLSVETLSLHRVTLAARCIPACVVHKIAQIFPNTKVLRLDLTNHSKLVALDTWVPKLEHLEEFHMEMSSVKKLRATRPNSWSTFAGLKVLKLVYPDGYITDTYCQRVFMRMSKLERLRICSETDHGEGLSAATLAQMRKRFAITWETLYASFWMQFFMRFS